MTELNQGDKIRLNGRETTHEVVSIDGDYVTLQNAANNARKSHEIKHTESGWIDTYDRRKLTINKVN